MANMFSFSTTSFRCSVASGRDFLQATYEGGVDEAVIAPIVALRGAKRYLVLEWD